MSNYALIFGLAALQRMERLGDHYRGDMHTPLMGAEDRQTESTVNAEPEPPKSRQVRRQEMRLARKGRPSGVAK